MPNELKPCPFCGGTDVELRAGALFNGALMRFRSMLHSAPSADVVEVVRCKDCKHFCPYEGEEHKGDCAELVGLESCVYEDDFCSYGERRSEE